MTAVEFCGRIFNVGAGLQEAREESWVKRYGGAELVERNSRYRSWDWEPPHWEIFTGRCPTRTLEQL